MSDEQGKKRGNRQSSQDFPKCGTGLPATVAPQRGISPSVKRDLLTEAVLIDERHEIYAQAVADGASYADAYARAGYVRDNSNAWRIAAMPDVAARIRMLMVAAAEHKVQSIAARMDLLDTIAHTDASEVARVVSVPCSACWSDAALADAMGRALSGNGAMPNTDEAQSDCPACRGLHRAYDITPTDQLSAAGRAIFRGVKLTATGSSQCSPIGRPLSMHSMPCSQARSPQPAALTAISTSMP
jgi:hypothetical protein